MIRPLARLSVALAFTAAALPSQVDRAAAWRRHREMVESSPFREVHWHPVGPRLQGGRIEAIAVHPEQPYTLYVGPGSGNLWKSTNDGLSWTPIFEDQPTFSIGSIAIAPSDPDVVWVGTGETQPRHSGYSYAGMGVFVSRDGGASWEHKGLSETHHIGKVVVHPADPDTVYVAAIGHFWSENAERGVFRTRDGGAHWDHVLALGTDTGAVDVVLDPGDPDRVYAAAWQVPHGPDSGLHRSTDGGDTWERLSSGLPEGATGRAGLAVAHDRPGTVYAFVDDWSPWTPPEDDPEAARSGREIVGAALYRSDDHGSTWRKVNQDDLYATFTIYGWKFCDVRVNPQDADEVFVLGNRAYHSTDGGKTFARIGEDILRLHDSKAEIMHLDHHDLWIDPARPDRLLLGNDGGLFTSHDRGATWLHLNTLPIGEFYFVHVEPDPDDSQAYTIFGGTQDNAALYGPPTAIEPFRNDAWQHVFLDPWTGGDAFVTLPDPTRPGLVYYEHQHGAMRVMDLHGESVQSWGPSAKGIRPRPPEGEAEWRFGWYTPFLISHHDPKTLLAGGNKVVRSPDLGETWQAISPDLADEGGGERAVVPFGTITMLAESPLDADVLYAGTEGGSVHATTDGGASWREVGRSHGLPRKWISRVVASSHEQGRLYVAQHGLREDDFAAYLWTSDNGGASWRSLAGGLPAASIHVVREDPTDPDILYVGTDLGVYLSPDRGERWQALCAGLPTTPVHDLAVHAGSGDVVAATHGRSVFVLEGLRERRE